MAAPGLAARPPVGTRPPLKPAPPPRPSVTLRSCCPGLAGFRPKLEAPVAAACRAAIWAACTACSVCMECCRAAWDFAATAAACALAAVESVAELAVCEVALADWEPPWPPDMFPLRKLTSARAERPGTTRRPTPNLKMAVRKMEVLKLKSRLEKMMRLWTKTHKFADPTALERTPSRDVSVTNYSSRKIPDQE